MTARSSLYPVIIGTLVGLLSTLLNFGDRFFSRASFFQTKGEQVFIPLFIAIVALLFHRISLRKNRRANHQTPAQNIAEILRIYHLGTFIVGRWTWFVRSIITVLSSLFMNVFGLHGAVFEFAISVLPSLAYRKKFFLEEKKNFVVAVFAAAMAVALGNPFVAAVLACEFLGIRRQPYIVFPALLASISASLSDLALRSFVLSKLTFAGATLDSIFSILISGPHSTYFENLTLTQAGLVTLGGLLLGVLSFLFSSLTANSFFRTKLALRAAFPFSFEIRMLISGVCIALVVWFIPYSFIGTSELWSDMSWGRLASAEGFSILAAKWVIFLFAFSSFGSLGIFTPILTFGALFGYSLGNLVSAWWAVPFAAGGAVAFFGAIFQVPLSATLLLLQFNSDPLSLWVSFLALFSVYVLSKKFRTESLQARIFTEQNVKLREGYVSSVFHELKVADVMSADVQKVSIDCSLEEFCRAVQLSRAPFIAIEAADGKYVGTLALEQLSRRIRRVIRSSPDEREFKAVERVFDVRELLSSQRFATSQVSPTDPLESVLEAARLSSCLAVVEVGPGHPDRFLGMLFELRVKERYNEEIARFFIQDS